jgi:hypothetical protein
MLIISQFQILLKLEDHNRLVFEDVHAFVCGFRVEIAKNIAQKYAPAISS